MKILAISLLRLGDLVLQRPLVESLRTQHPQGEIHLLLNKQFATVEFLFAGLVDKFIYFDREGLQKSCGKNEYNILWGYKQLHHFVDEINQTSYDVIYNFTHNRLSAHLSGLINSQDRVGIYSAGGAFYGLTNPWIQFFNKYFGAPEAAGFHYTELLGRALEIPLTQVSTRSRQLNSRKIFIQPLTSDVKKNWSLGKYAALLTLLRQNTSYEIKVLGAPFEKETLLAAFTEGDLLICDLQGAEEALREASILITGDTSIKHVAAMLDLPILELALGSSQPLQVGAYSNNSVILQSRVACSPCPHSQNCSQVTHRCGDNLQVEAVFEAVRVLLNLERKTWESYAQRYPELNVLKTEIRHIMGWTVHCLSLAQKIQFDEVIQTKTMIVEELNRQMEKSKGVSNGKGPRKLSDSGAAAS